MHLQEESTPVVGDEEFMALEITSRSSITQIGVKY
jgi:hypothetical protein